MGYSERSYPSGGLSGESSCRFAACPGLLVRVAAFACIGAARLVGCLDLSRSENNGRRKSGWPTLEVGDGPVRESN